MLNDAEKQLLMHREQRRMVANPFPPSTRRSTMAKEKPGSETKPRRLGRGLSSLMGGAPPAAATGQAQPATPPATSSTPEPPPAQSPAQAEPDKPVSRETGLQDSPSTPQDNAVSRETDLSQAPAQVPPTAAGPGITMISVHSLRPNHQQPRKTFDDHTLDQLAQSIRQDGLMQPIVVTVVTEEGAAQWVDGTAEISPITHEIVAGERRWRAAKLAGLNEVPAIVRQLTERQMAEWALIENLQREDLNPMDKAEAFDHLCKHFNISPEELGERVGQTRSAVANTMRLLSLHVSVQELVRQEVLPMGLARALAGLGDVKMQQQLARQAVREGWSVRRAEQAVRAAGRSDGQSPTGETHTKRKQFQKAAHLKDLEEQMAQQLGCKVRIRPGRKKGAGTLAIEFYSLDQFDHIVGKLGVKVDG